MAISFEPQKALGFRTERLLAQSWTACLEVENQRQKLIEELHTVLVPDVLRHLPEPLQISAGPEAIARWISARDAESDVFTVRDKTSSSLLGLLILAEFPGPNATTTIHLGYLFAKTAWGMGYATELLLELIQWLSSQDRKIQLLGGVGGDNPASARVLRKAGFEETPGLSTADTKMFSRTLP